MVNQFEPIFEVGLTVWAKGSRLPTKRIHSWGRMIAEVSGCKDELQERLGKSSYLDAKK